MSDLLIFIGIVIGILWALWLWRKRKRQREQEAKDRDYLKRLDDKQNPLR